MSPNGLLNIVVALACEARFFLDRYRLSRLNQINAYPVYANVERNIYLIVSGVGKIKSAAALSFLHGYLRCPSWTCYLNVGIAGGAMESIGAIFLAHKISDIISGKNFYPWPIRCDVLASRSLITVDQPTDQYPEDALIDMEAFGFHQAALALVAQEQVQTIKIISDNSAQSLPKINASMVTDLFVQNQSGIEKIVDLLLNLSIAEQPQDFSDLMQKFLENFHITEYQRHQLKEILRRWQIIFPNENPFELCQHAKNFESAFAQLNDRLTGNFS